MQTSTISLIIAIVSLILSLFLIFQTKFWKEDKKSEGSSFSTRPLQLQAYERLVILCERIALPSLISRVSQPGLSAREMQIFMLEAIKQEYEYNASQLIYVSTIAWDAVRNLRDQSMLIINQIANVLPPDAKSSDLNKQLLEVIMNHSDKALHNIVLEALNYEAKQLLRD
ncbi:MAG TPA: hypothetical protein VNS32_11990 [Flavisolibacter sp.]|nr:hypothetical protein [Flavisolibacter sp.]